MGIFRDHSFKWDGASYTIPSDKIMGGLCRVEEELTAAEVGWYFRERHSVPSTKLAKALSALIIYADGDVSPEKAQSVILASVDGQGTVDALTVVLDFLHQSTEKTTNGAGTKKDPPSGEVLARTQAAEGSSSRPSSRRAAGG